MTAFIHRLFAECATVLSVNHTRFVRIAVKPLIGANSMNKFYILGAILCAIATVVSAFRGHPLSFLLFMIWTAAFLFLMTDN